LKRIAPAEAAADPPDAPVVLLFETLPPPFAITVAALLNQESPPEFAADMLPRPTVTEYVVPGVTGNN